MVTIMEQVRTWGKEKSKFLSFFNILFPNSKIAGNMTLVRTKLTYVFNFGSKKIFSPEMYGIDEKSKSELERPLCFPADIFRALLCLIVGGGGRKKCTRGKIINIS